MRFNSEYHCQIQKSAGGIITAIKYKDLEQAHFYSQAKRGSHLALGSVGHTPHGGHHRH